MSQAAWIRELAAALVKIAAPEYRKAAAQNPAPKEGTRDARKPAA